MMAFTNMLERFRTPFWPQWLAACEVCLLTIMVGMNLGWTSPFLAKLSNPNPPFEASKEQIVWVASLVNLCRSFGTIMGSVITFRGGSKLTIYFCGFYFLISWICLCFANSIKVVFISLVCNGISQGSISAIFPLYIAEIADPKVRGNLVSFVVQGTLTGSLLGNILGTYLEPWQYAVINLVISVFFVLTYGFFPDTPHFLVRSEKKEEAAKAIQFYNRNVDVSKELASLTDFLANSPKLTVLGTFRKLGTPVNRKALFSMNVVYSFGHFTAITTIQSYLEVLITDAQITMISPPIVVIIMGVISILSSWAAVIIVGKFGRTTILLTSCILISIGLFGWGLIYHLLDLGFKNPELQWITLIFVIIYRSNIVIGMIPVVPTILSEIFAPDVKYMAICMCNVLSGLCAFLSNKYFQLMIDTFSHKYVFYFLATCSLLLGIYSKIMIPETKGKSLAQIQASLNSEKTEMSKETTRL